MVTTEATLINGTSESHVDEHVEIAPVVNHTVFPTFDIELPSSLKEKIASTTVSIEAPPKDTSVTTSLPAVSNDSPSTAPSIQPIPTLSIDSSTITPGTGPAPTISVDSPLTTSQKAPPTPTISIDSPTTTEHKTASFHSNSVADPLLFSTDLVSPVIAAQLPPTYTIRPLKKSDYAIGFLDCLRVLTVVGDVTETEFNERYEFLSGQGKGGYYLLVIEDGGRIVGTGALIVERKFIHHLGLVGHIEDIAVAKDQQGKKLGLKLIQALDFIAEKVGCYKTILDCSEANEGFYVKCGFKRAGLEMAHYYEKPKST
ncbi:Phosphoglucosamine transacetylase [Hyphodiscus hymeniophilus]|uniref:Glucosamine 6-phosphate N-acetyltransferase n=1 Tax=Hyphodiscus hymeniophilus TaxID=353542 RepID=A0A9P7AZ35_9HELO|nr:Phosphoglucosamine transacetylase [Hyphodiscus hymeniophilus]